MSWQHYLYSKLGKTEVSSDEIIEKPASGATEKTKTKEQIIQETVERIVAMAKVLYGLHMVGFFQVSKIRARRLNLTAKVPLCMKKKELPYLILLVFW